MSQTVSDFIVQRLHQWGVRHIFGSPGDGINGVFGAVNRADGKIGFAEMIGLRGIYLDSPELLGSAWEQALASEMPVVLEVKTDPEVPPVPPHITLQQAKNFSLALMKGDPNEGSVIKGAARQVLESILPGRD